MFTLTTEIIKKITFYIENQQQVSLINLNSGELLPAATVITDDSAYAPLPTWQSKDGYQLMLDFTHSTNDSELKKLFYSREKLFRRFKDYLKANSQLELAWYSYKEQKFKHYITEWYEKLAGKAELEDLKTEFEVNPDELIDSDFFITDKSTGNTIDYLISDGYNNCGYLKANIITNKLIITHIEVVPAFRQLGLATRLLHYLINRQQNKDLSIELTVSKQLQNFGLSLKNLGFKEEAIVYKLKSKN
ncbi:MAG: GNAT family N-acetyltransferase [Spirochaetaceae bacterium]|nr:GNAT family N-acetyltransferase [Spirochaetaceae bacterium]